MPTFPSDTVAAVLSHMNGDHPADNLLIVRAFGAPEATSASMIGLDELAGLWNWTDDRATAELRVPWSRAIADRAEIRREVVALYETACERLGVEPRPH